MRLKLLLLAKSFRLQTFCAWTLLFNGLSGIVVPLIASVAGGGDIDPTLLLSVTPLMGVAAGLLLLRGRIAGAVAGVCFYAIQSISYFSPAFSFSFKSGLSLAAVFVLTDGVLIMNWAAFILGTLCAVLLWRPKLT